MFHGECVFSVRQWKDGQDALYLLQEPLRGCFLFDAVIVGRFWVTAVERAAEYRGDVTSAAGVRTSLSAVLVLDQPGTPDLE